MAPVLTGGGECQARPKFKNQFLEIERSGGGRSGCVGKVLPQKRFSSAWGVFQALAHNRHALEKMLPKMAILGQEWTGVCLVGAPHFRSGPTPKFCQVANSLSIAPYYTSIRPLDRILWLGENRSHNRFSPKMSHRGKPPQQCSSEITFKNMHQNDPYRAQFSNIHNFWSTESILMGPKYVGGIILEFLTPRRHPQYMHPNGTNPQFWNFFEKIFFFFKIS